MVGIVLVTHGNLAKELMNVCMGITGGCNQVSIVTFSSSESRQVLCDKVEQTICHADKGAGVLILVDSFGGSPSTVCLGMHPNFPVEVISGLNLAMILEAVYYCDKVSLSELAKRVEDAGKKGIVNATELYRRKLKSQG
ncbi:MAG: PTS sugar transporter subunit IIA [bacterium]